MINTLSNEENTELSNESLLELLNFDFIITFKFSHSSYNSFNLLNY